MLSSKTKLLNFFNNKLLNRGGSSNFTLTYSKDALKYIEVLYLEGKILSFYRKNDKLVGFVNFHSNSQNDKVLFEKQKYKPSLKYSDVAKLTSSLKTVYFHTTDGLHPIQPLEDVKRQRLGGVPIFVV